MNRVTHHQHHASIVLDGDIDWPLIHEVVRAIEDAVEYYHYTLVELRVRSLGGSNEALGYLLERLDVWREQGVRLRTRALGRTSSGAAVLVALGDERLAEPAATLRFHGASMYRNGDVSAPVAAALHDKLTRANDRMIERLVDRVLAGPHVHGEHGAKEADREIVEGLCLGASLDPGGTAPARLQMLAGALGQTVDTAFGEHDWKSLVHLYAHLFQIDRPISPELGATLGLLDRAVAMGWSPSRAHDTAPSFASSSIPFASPEGVVASEALTRHVLVLGDDSTAASRHCLAPIVAALARAPEGEVGTVLVMGPDRELLTALHAVAPDRLQTLDSDWIVLDVMAGERSLDVLLQAGRWMTAATALLKRTLDMVPGSPARCLLDVSGRVVDPVLREGTHLAVSVLAFVLMMTSRASPCSQGWVPDESRDGGLCADLMERANGVESERGPNSLALASWLLGVVPGLLPATVVKEAIHAVGGGGTEVRDVHQGLSDGGQALSHPSGHARDVLSAAQAILAPFAAPATRRSIYFGCEPAFNPGEALDLAAWVSGTHGARFLVHEPRDDGSDGLVAVGIKLLFLEAVLSRSARGGLPCDAFLCGYVAQNFERYATDMDRVFLDQAQSAGAFAVLASRSVSSIEHAVRDLPGGEGLPSYIWSAAGTKVLLRSTDPRTQKLARRLAPRRPGLRDLLGVRPLAGLGPHESYISRLDGRVERRRLPLLPPPRQFGPSPSSPGITDSGSAPASSPDGEPT